MSTFETVSGWIRAPPGVHIITCNSTQQAPVVAVFDSESLNYSTSEIFA